MTIRDIANCAGVSPGLVLHHFESKRGLCDAVDDYVSGVFDSLMDAVADLPEASSGGEAASGSLAELLLAGVPPQSPIPAYLRRLLLSGDEVGRVLFAKWLEISRDVVTQLEASGGMTRSADPEMRAAFLLVNDLAMILLHEHVADAIGTDPLTPEGGARWASTAMDVYTDGVFRSPPREESS